MDISNNTDLSMSGALTVTLGPLTENKTKNLLALWQHPYFLIERATGFTSEDLCLLHCASRPGQFQSFCLHLGRMTVYLTGMPRVSLKPPSIFLCSSIRLKWSKFSLWFSSNTICRWSLLTFVWKTKTKVGPENSIFLLRALGKKGQRFCPKWSPLFQASPI